MNNRGDTTGSAVRDIDQTARIRIGLGKPVFAKRIKESSTHDDDHGVRLVTHGLTTVALRVHYATAVCRVLSSTSVSAPSRAARPAPRTPDNPTMLSASAT